MSRIQLIEPAAMTSEQRAVYGEAVAGKRGHAPLPLLAWLASPELASRAQRMGEFVRYDTTLEPRLSELAILVVAHDWRASYEWETHKREALHAGLDAEIIDAIAANKLPLFECSDEALVFEFSRSLLQRREVSSALYDQAIASFGERGVAELVGILGYYTLVAMTLNVFEILSPA